MDSGSRNCFSQEKGAIYHLLCTHLATPRRAIPKEPTSTPACIMPQGRAKLPDPTLDLAKLKKVAILLQKRCMQHGNS